MGTLDLWPLCRLDPLSSRSSILQTDPLARAASQVLFLSSCPCPKGVTLRCSSALLLWVCQWAHTLCSPLSYCNEEDRDCKPQILSINPWKFLVPETIAMQKPCTSGSDLRQCALFNCTGKRTLVSVRLLHYRGGQIVQMMQPGAALSFVKGLNGNIIQGGEMNLSWSFSSSSAHMLTSWYVPESLQGIHCCGKQMSLRKTNDS